MLLTVALVLAVIWLLCVLVFKIAGGAIHLILVIALIALVVHFVKRKAPPPTT